MEYFLVVYEESGDEIHFLLFLLKHILLQIKEPMIRLINC